MSWPLGFAWSLLVLAAWFGWGELVAGTVGRREADLGLKAGWGMAALCGIGGGLVALGWATDPAILVLVGIGVVAGLPNLRAIRHRATLPLLLCLAALAIHLGLYIFTASMDCADDRMAYLPLVKRMLATGALDEPFSLRRLAAFGGHSVLQAMVLVIADHRALAVVEHGLAPVVVYALSLGLLRDAPLSPWLRHALALLLGLGILVPPINHHSYQTGTVAFLTLARTVAEPITGFRRIAVLALVSAGLLSLRAHYLIGLAVALPILLYQRPLVPQALRAAGVGALTLLLLLPWMWALQRSSGTPFYPLLPGHAAYGYQILSIPMSAVEHMRFMLGYFTTEHAALLIGGTVLALLGRSRAGLAVAVAGLATALVMLAKFTMASYWDFARYVYPMAAAAVVLGCAGVAHRVGARLGAREGMAAAASLVVALAVVAYHGVLANYPLPAPSAADIAALGQAQDAVPPGQRLAVAVDAPYLLDYRRNDVLSLDYPGAAGPAPGVPLGQGGAALAGYLRAHGVEALLVQDMATRYACLWIAPPPEEPPTGAMTIFRDSFLLFMSDVAELEQTHGARRFGPFRVITLPGK